MNSKTETGHRGEIQEGVLDIKKKKMILFPFLLSLWFVLVICGLSFQPGGFTIYRGRPI